MGNRRGLTLIEMLVVITIIMLLVSVLGVVIINMTTASKNAATQGLVHELSGACEMYYVDFRNFPPGAGTSSAPLHQYLGAPRRILQPGGPEAVKPTLVEFKEGQLRLPTGRIDTSPNPSVEVVDAFGNDLRYRNEHPNPVNHMNRKGIDIWSPGKDGVDDVPTATQTDDINNWNKDR